MASASPIAPPAASTASSFTPASAATSAAAPTGAYTQRLSAACPSFTSACTTMAMTTGPMPYISHPTCGVVP